MAGADRQQRQHSGNRDLQQPPAAGQPEEPRAQDRAAVGVLRLAVPLLWLVPALMHPDEPGDLFEGIADQANKWIFVHVAQLVLTPFLAAGGLVLLGGGQSVAAL